MKVEEISLLLSEINSFKAADKAVLEEFRIRFLGKKGIVRELFTDSKNASPESRKEWGLAVNELKDKVEKKINPIKETLETVNPEGKGYIDLTLPAEPIGLGTRHPISIVRREMIEIFERIGFTVSGGPEIESDWYNFTALNIPQDHPARDMQDTFFIKKDPDILLRTHTSPQQIRVMEGAQPPIRIICPGRVYRNETISARSHCIFHQIEGLYVNEGVSFADMKQTLYYFARTMFGEDIKIRLRPSYFPFTEPSAEMDISCIICNGEGCP